MLGPVIVAVFTVPISHVPGKAWLTVVADPIVIEPPPIFAPIVMFEFDDVALCVLHDKVGIVADPVNVGDAFGAYVEVAVALVKYEAKLF